MQSDSYNIFASYMLLKKNEWLNDMNGLTIFNKYICL